MPLADLVRDVARKREALMEARRVVEIRTAYFEEENADVFDALNVAKIEKEEAEDALRSAVLAASEEEVRATDGVKIRKVRRYEYDDLEAIEWSAQTLNFGAVSLNRREFEKMVRAIDDARAKGVHIDDDMYPDFVTITDEKQATIDRDLSGVLG